MVEDYYAARDSRDERRESEQHYQDEDDDFARKVPLVTFKQWLIGRKGVGQWDAVSPGEIRSEPGDATSPEGYPPEAPTPDPEEHQWLTSPRPTARPAA